MDRIYELTPVPTLVLDPYLRIVRASNSLLEHISVTSDKCVGHDLYQCLETCLGLDEWWPIHEAIQQATTDRGLKSVPGIKNVYGNVYRFRIVPIFAEQLLHVLVEIETVASNEEASGNARTAPKNDLQDMLDSIGLFSIYRVDASGMIRSWSRTAAQMTGYSAKDIMGKDHAVLYEDPAFLKRNFSNSSSSSLAASNIFSEPSRWEAWVLRKDGTRFLGGGSLSPIPDNSSKMGMTVVIEDVTRQRAFRGVKMAKRLEDNHKARTFLRLAKDPMQSINENISTLKSTTLDEDQLAAIEKMERSKIYLNSKMGGYIKKADDQVINIREEVKALVEGAILGLHSLLEYEIDISENVPSALRGDHLKLRRLLDALITNPVHLSRRGRVKISVVAEDISGNDCTIRFSVTDEGQTLSLAALEAHLGDQPTRTDEKPLSGEGFGTSLAGIGSLAQSMGITIGHSSNSGRQGNIFWFWCKLEKWNEKEPGVWPISSRQRVAMMLPNKVERELAMRSLHQHGVTDITSAGTAAKLVDFVRSDSIKPFDIIFIDFDMNQSAAIAATKKIKNRKINIPIIAVGTNLRSDWMDGLISGRLLRPYKVTAFQDAVKQYALTPAPPSPSPAVTASSTPASSSKKMNDKLPVRAKTDGTKSKKREDVSQSNSEATEDLKDSDWVEL